MFAGPERHAAGRGGVLPCGRQQRQPADPGGLGGRELPAAAAPSDAGGQRGRGAKEKKMN